MTIGPHEFAAIPVQRFVLALNTMLAETKNVALRAGTKRRIAREAAQRKAQAEPIADKIKSRLAKKPEPVTSRQVRRAMGRKQQKSLLAAARRQAMQDKAPGGSAALA